MERETGLEPATSSLEGNVSDGDPSQTQPSNQDVVGQQDPVEAGLEKRVEGKARKLSVVVAHPQMVPWWIAEDLTPTEARRMLKALTAVVAAMTPRVGLVDGELASLINTVLELIDTGNDRQDLEVAVEAVVLTLESQ
jgi:hypothetical protein